MSGRGEWKEYKNERSCTCQVRLPPGTDLLCCRRLRCPGPTPFFVVPAPPRSDPHPVSYSTGSCRRKERAERCQRKNNKNLAINQILPFIIPNIGPVARNGGGGEMTKKDRCQTSDIETSNSRHFEMYSQKMHQDYAAGDIIRWVCGFFP